MNNVKNKIKDVYNSAVMIIAKQNVWEKRLKSAEVLKLKESC